MNNQAHALSHNWMDGETRYIDTKDVSTSSLDPIDVTKRYDLDDKNFQGLNVVESDWTADVGFELVF